MCHGHRYGVKYGYNSIFIEERKLDARYSFIWSFTYTNYRRSDGIILMNPGSVSLGMR